MSEFESIDRLLAIVRERAKASPEESYTAKLMAKGRSKICQKLGEEAVELALAGVLDEKKEAISESADLLYHLCVLWADMGISPQDIGKELTRREAQSGIDEKKKRKHS